MLDVHPHLRRKESPLCLPPPYWRCPQKVSFRPHQLDFFIIDPLHQTSASQSLCLISPQVESAVLRRLKVLKRCQDVHLRPEETQALM